jgi:hypothetical protein
MRAHRPDPHNWRWLLGRPLKRPALTIAAGSVCLTLIREGGESHMTSHSKRQPQVVREPDLCDRCIECIPLRILNPMEREVYAPVL